MANDKTPQRIRGTQDIFGEDQRRFQHVVDTFDRVRRLYAFQRVELPVFEATAVFARSLGEATDVVSKEMYSFEDRGGDSITLRPEFTAGIARAYITEGWQQHAPLKIATHGPLFRYERPQKGRYRQFHQIDAEIIGAAEPQADVELLALADQLLKELGVADGVTLQLNTLGDAETRDAWRAALVAHFERHRGDLSEDSLARLDKNPLRILDSKDPRDRPIADSAPDIDAYLSAEAGAFFEAVNKGLQAAGIVPTRNSRLVRGLDYYRHTAFEFVTDRLGAQGTVLGGGRYDGLIGQLGGPETPAVGWAAGIERLAMLIEIGAEPDPLITILAESVQSLPKAVRLSSYLRFAVPGALRDINEVRWTNRKPRFNLVYKVSLRKQFEKARSRGDAVIIVRDDDEMSLDRMLLDFKAPASEVFEPLAFSKLLEAIFMRVGSNAWTVEGYPVDYRIDLAKAA